MSMSAATLRSLRVKAPSRRFSSEVMSAMMRRPSITWKMPRRTILSGSMPLMRSPSNTISPRVTSPSSVFSRPEIAFSVVDLPAPLAPSSATIAPFGTSRRQAAQHQDHVVIDHLDVVDAEQRGGGGDDAARGVASVAAVMSSQLPLSSRRARRCGTQYSRDAVTLPRCRGVRDPPLLARDDAHLRLALAQRDRQRLPAKPFRLARQFDGLDLLELDGALGDQIGECRPRSAR